VSDIFVNSIMILTKEPFMIYPTLLQLARFGRAIVNRHVVRTTHWTCLAFFLQIDASEYSAVFNLIRFYVPQLSKNALHKVLQDFRLPEC